MMQPARHECHVYYLLRAEKAKISARIRQAGKMHDTFVKREASSSQKILRTRNFQF